MSQPPVDRAQLLQMIQLIDQVLDGDFDRVLGAQSPAELQSAYLQARARLDQAMRVFAEYGAARPE